MPLVREQIESGKSVTFVPRGTSMLPMLREGIDSVTLSAPPKKLKKYDIPLYQRENGQYILHRVVKVGETYTCIGDNQFVYEKGVTHEQVIAVCTAFSRGEGKKISVHSPMWRLYAVVWNYSRFPRRILAALRRRTLKLMKKS